MFQYCEVLISDQIQHLPLTNQSTANILAVVDLNKPRFEVDIVN